VTKNKGFGMEKTAILSENRVDPDIEAMLEQVSLRASDAYRLGYAEGQMHLRDRAMSKIKNEMARPAELFYHSLLKIIPKEDVLQHRIGVDYTTKVPTTLTVISSKHEDEMVEIMYMAGNLELYLFHEHGIDCSFWIITDYCLDQHLIDHDFPYCRRGV
jgi:hypothetical protein